MEPGVRIEVIYSDHDMLELRVSAANGAFAARTDLFATHGAAAHLARGLEGFPDGQTDRRHFELGTFASGYAGGGARFSFRALDSSGHCAVRVVLRTHPWNTGGIEATADFQVPFEPAALDDFVSELAKMVAERGSSAQLVATVNDREHR